MINMPELRKCRNITCDMKAEKMKRCGGCKHAFYCSRTCQKQHWKKHKPNCIPPESSLHQLFDACAEDLLLAFPAACDYGFDNMRLYYRSRRLGYFRLEAEVVLLGIFEAIRKNVYCLELDETHIVSNTIGASMRMIHDAYERNALDEFLHSYIGNVFQQYSKEDDRRTTWSYCSTWLECKLVLGPTRLSGFNTKGEVLDKRIEIFRRLYEQRNISTAD